MASWALLDEKSEFELHKSRLFNVEERPFKRIATRLSTISSVASKAARRNGTTENGTDAANVPTQDSLKEDVTLDFAAFESSIARLQFLHDANQRERERYAADQQRILTECQTVRTNNGQLREQLNAARATLDQRKKFDELADKITSNRLLRPREDQLANLAKLEEECRELERESGTYKETWKERREQFNRIMEEGMMLRRQIRDEKEEVDRREGMNEEGEDEAEGERVGATPRPVASDNATPRPDGEVQSKGEDDVENEDGSANAAASSRDRTPLGDTPAQDREGSRAAPTPADSTSWASRSSGRYLQAPDGQTPSLQGDQDAGDVDMEYHAENQTRRRDDEEGEDEMEVEE
ncbi:Tho complex subunit 7/Mft1p [Metarhizium album ARSEF 1941]|uniref:Tho complex subunit 7/Mft1p n=1 Tax=Metarhizium album (strain ARSEF 1941) TaxID=1081103 RepID=A0A0B2WV89_METAS|nr:Tho complex subunit 7/Mft1p [Metarhizium album ARSEF 1941]KHO00027.1 Tho complex subunit 7/Mft1p [Metarhizium album ARSEF 1941]